MQNEISKSFQHNSNLLSSDISELVIYALKSDYPAALWHHGSDEFSSNGFQQHPLALHYDSLIPYDPHSTLFSLSDVHLSWFQLIGIELIGFW